MARRLLLIRHAKSAWDDADAPDHARVLNARGRRSATAIGRWLAERAFLPGEILSSDAARTRETAERIMAELPVRPGVTWTRGLYLAEPEALQAALQGATAPVVALIGHNPGIGAFASAMVRTPPDHPRFADYPTCATTVIDFPAEGWAQVAPGSGAVAAFVVPRDLTD